MFVVAVAVAVAVVVVVVVVVAVAVVVACDAMQEHNYLFCCYCCCLLLLLLRLRSMPQVDPVLPKHHDEEYDPWLSAYYLEETPNLLFLKIHAAVATLLESAMVLQVRRDERESALLGGVHATSRQHQSQLCLCL